MNPIFHPSLLSLDNAMEEFIQDYRKKQGLPVHPSGKERVGGNADSVRVSGQHGLCCSADSRNSLAQQEVEAAKEAQFMEDVARLQKQAPPKKIFSWGGLFALLALSAVVMWMTYSVVVGW